MASSASSTGARSGSHAMCHGMVAWPGWHTLQCRTAARHIPTLAMWHTATQLIPPSLPRVRSDSAAAQLAAGTLRAPVRSALRHALRCGAVVRRAALAARARARLMVLFHAVLATARLLAMRRAMLLARILVALLAHLAAAVAAATAAAVAGATALEAVSWKVVPEAAAGGRHGGHVDRARGRRKGADVAQVGGNAGVLLSPANRTSVCFTDHSGWRSGCCALLQCFKNCRAACGGSVALTEAPLP